MADGDVLKIVSGHQAFGAAPGGGEPFDGGTITQPLTIESSETAVNAFLYVNPIGATAFDSLFTVANDGSPVFDVNAYGLGHLEDWSDLLNFWDNFVDDAKPCVRIYPNHFHEAVLTARGGVGELTTTNVFEVRNSADAVIFAVRNDGSIHIKTGTSIVADL